MRHLSGSIILDNSKGALEKIEADYTSENTDRLSVKQIEKLLRSLDYIKKELKNNKK